MKRIHILILFILVVLLISGCGLMGEKDISKMNPKDLPDVTAFQDEFTREFMASTEEVEDGYYLFESKTGGYTMWFPENAQMGKNYYERKQKGFERLRYAENETEQSPSYVVIATYDHFHQEKESRRLLNLLSRAENYKGDYEKLEYRNNTIYYATSEERIISGEKQATWYNFFGLIKSNNSNQSLEYRYSVQCDEQPENCTYNLKAIEQRVKNIMKSVEFKGVVLDKD